MKEFPIRNLKPRIATLSKGGLGDLSLEIHFEPFTVRDLFDGDTVLDDFDQPLRADFITLPTHDLAELAGQVFEFPINPAEGYIDASVYFKHAHNPIDISRLEFENGDDGGFLMTVASRWLMTLEGTAPNDFDYKFTVPIKT